MASKPITWAAMQAEIAKLESVVAGVPEASGDRLKPGMKITIAGLRFGKEYADGFTTRCKPGRETVLEVGELEPGPLPPVAPAIVAHRVAPLQYGPAKRKRW